MTERDNGTILLAMLHIDADPATYPAINSLAGRLGQLSAGDLSRLHSAGGWLVRQISACGLRNVTLGEDTLVLVLRGIKEVDAYRAGTGCFLYFPAGQACTLTNIPDEQGMYLALALSFSDDILARSATLLPPSSPRPGSVPLLLTLLNTFLDLTLLHDDAALARMQMEQILYALRGAGLPLFRNGRDTAANVRALVEEEPGKAWTAADIAARMHMSERSLRRRMEESGTSLGATIRLARLHAGLGLLQQSGFNVAQISVACGYQSPSRFAARFREHFGISPGDVIRSRGMRAGTGAF
ncbi:MAG TPA: helix-turn-helix transcriptional regulator [Candidatus Mailhella merdavium]|nr:helix-turn-helix transcriptional regulator [Candidatus Mailhella merdavium]